MTINMIPQNSLSTSQRPKKKVKQLNRVLFYALLVSLAFPFLIVVKRTC